MVNEEDVEQASLHPPLVETLVQDMSTVNGEKAIYVVFDLETTGQSWQHDEIINLAAQILDPNWIQLKDAIFPQLV